nr:MAG TPA_asm: hypothetical protein [Bacteriophage sp.]
MQYLHRNNSEHAAMHDNLFRVLFLNIFREAVQVTLL